MTAASLGGCSFLFVRWGNYYYFCIYNTNINKE